MANADFNAIRDQFAAASVPEHSGFFRINDHYFTVRCTCLATLTALNKYLARFVCPATDTSSIVIDLYDQESVSVPGDLTLKQPSLGKSPREAWKVIGDGRLVHKVRSGMVFLFSPTQHIGIGPCLANINQVVNFINNRYMELMIKRECLLLHAAGVVHPMNGKGLALCGFAGAGKSTLAMHLLEAGYGYLSNDRILIPAQPTSDQMLGIAKYPRINPGTALANPRLAGLVAADKASRYRSMSQTELWEIEDKHDVPVERLYGDDRVQLRAPFSALVILNWQHGGGTTRIDRISVAQRLDLFPAYAKDAGLFFLPQPGMDGTFNAEQYQVALAQTPVYEISGGVDFGAAVTELQAL